MNALQHILAQSEPWLHSYGYVALALTVMLEGAGVPLPGVMLMSGAALLAGRGEMNLAAVVFTAWPAAMAGDNLGYWIGRGGGRRLLLRAGVSRRRLARFGDFFRRYGTWLILFGRFFDGTRQLNGLVAGSAGLSWPRFAVADMAGSALWVSVWVIGLYALERHAAALHVVLEGINPWVAGGVLVALAALFFWLFRWGSPASRSPKAAGSGSKRGYHGEQVAKD